ncbi:MULTISPECIES: efflux RND transporter periplasmic adaptor subunit [unclassified Beijerinckia]|uniref:efflux RND transporter periplasmic adaptor subunit n=1 Tax=unclassified Beijerinckia TaxID=2638183 RepID=UPI0008943971|nr:MULTISPECIES: efflux RND transporter periplasmic adaptor subunit [unclassified Beijerinckia]MDH7796690.1 cobalt-zinc-cadmium efflux system membrane fusion protein [Beijerinckia sp. GAS462]SEC55851.1 membrane fusion protein, cobalt-zinc-cadmium efflux system [Beijerinckia sp. 28-YEA-48]
MNGSDAPGHGSPTARRPMPKGLAAGVIVVALIGAAGWYWRPLANSAPPVGNARPLAAAKSGLKLSAEQLATVTIETVGEERFAAETTTEGKITVDEERVTPVFSQFAGRVTKIFARPGQQVKQGEPLFTLEAVDVIQSENDLMAAVSTLNKARSSLRLTQMAEKRLRDLAAANAIAMRELQQAQNDLNGAQNDVRSAEIALEAVRNRLRIMGKSDAEIANFEQTGKISTETMVTSPIDGIIIQRKVGPGQFLSTSATDPAFILGDLSKVWLVASVRESDVAQVFPGQKLEFRVVAYPDRVFHGEIALIGSSIDPSSRRIPVRANIDNAEGLLRPEMFTSVRLIGRSEGASPSVPREALIYEGDKTRVWVVNSNDRLELRQIQPGFVSGNRIQIVKGLKSGERIVTRGALFIDRAATLAGS